MRLGGGERAGRGPSNVSTMIIRPPQRGVEGALVGKGSEIAAEGEPARLMQGYEAFKEETAEQAGEHAHGEEGAGLAGDPAPAVRRQAAAGNDDVDV